MSCPCDIARWLRERSRPPWTRSLSPDDFVTRVPASTQVVALTGSADNNTFPALAKDYVTKLSARGITARFVEVAGAGHGFSGLAAATRTEVEGLIGP